MSEITDAAERLLNEVELYGHEDERDERFSQDIAIIARAAIAGADQGARIAVLERELAIAEGVENNLVSDNERLRVALDGDDQGARVRELEEALREIGENIQGLGEGKQPNIDEPARFYFRVIESICRAALAPTPEAPCTDCGHPEHPGALCSMTPCPTPRCRFNLNAYHHFKSGPEPGCHAMYGDMRCGAGPEWHPASVPQPSCQGAGGQHGD